MGLAQWQPVAGYLPPAGAASWRRHPDDLPDSGQNQTHQRFLYSSNIAPTRLHPTFASARSRVFVLHKDLWVSRRWARQQRSAFVPSAAMV